MGQPANPFPFVGFLFWINQHDFYLFIGVKSCQLYNQSSDVFQNFASWSYYSGRAWMKQRDANRYVRYLAKFIVNFLRFWHQRIAVDAQQLTLNINLNCQGRGSYTYARRQKVFKLGVLSQSLLSMVSTRLIHSAGSGFMISIPFFCCSRAISSSLRIEWMISPYFLFRSSISSLNFLFWDIYWDIDTITDTRSLKPKAAYRAICPQLL